MLQIDIRKFRDIVKRLQLINNESQLSQALEAYVNLNDRYTHILHVIFDLGLEKCNISLSYVC
jgi:hypothetical protein